MPEIAKTRQKIIVVDTSVLIHDPTCLNKFENNCIAVPFIAIEEIDYVKKRHDDDGFNAREISRALDALTQKNQTHHDIPVNNQGGTLSIVPHNDKFCKKHFSEINNDNRIISVALKCKEEENQKRPSEQKEVILISKDTNMRIKARALGIMTEDYESDKVFNYSYTGFRSIVVDKDYLAKIYESPRKCIEVDQLLMRDPMPNEFFVLTTEPQSKHPTITIYKKKDNLLHLVELRYDALKEDGIRIKPRNLGQHLAWHLLTDPEIPLVTINGIAGTGKTVLAIAAGWHQLNGQYQQILLGKPTISPEDHDLGYLPGTLEEKMDPWMKSFYLAMDIIFDPQAAGDEEKNTAIRSRKEKPYQDYFTHGLIDIAPITFLRGQTLPNRFIIIDEAQNLRPHSTKLIITRAGFGTKIVLLGDIEQIDNRFLDIGSNGLSHVIEKMKTQEISGHLMLTQVERPLLAEIGAKIL
ncbi:MAG: PhoH family protein [Parcubacteria group bacterium]|nr:PhoH family protein [Parcubacteria group bacterium]